MTWEIVFARETEDHLQALTARQRSTVLDRIEKQLRDQPDTETRNRKQMGDNPIASWELRVGDLRVYYELGEPQDEESQPIVNVLAIGIKRRNRVWIGGEEIKL